MKALPKALPILTCLNMYMTHYEKSYCFPSQKTILKFLKDSLDFKVSLRQLNRNMKDIERAGYIQRQRRHRREKGKGMVFHSTLYRIGALGWRMLYKIKAITKGQYLKMLLGVKSALARKQKPERTSRPRSGLVSLKSILEGNKSWDKSG